MRDCNEASWTQVLDTLEFMSDAAPHIPILVDADTGYGNFNNARRLVKKLEDRGIAGMSASTWRSQLCDVVLFVSGYITNWFLFDECHCQPTRLKTIWRTKCVICCCNRTRSCAHTHIHVQTRPYIHMM